MLVQWLEPSIKARVGQVETGLKHDVEYAQSKKGFLLAFSWLIARVSEDCHDQLQELESFMNLTINRVSDISYRAGLADGLTLHKDISFVTGGAVPQAATYQEKEGEDKQGAVTDLSVQVVTRQVAEIAKRASDRDWELRDLLKRKRMDSPLLHRTTDDLLDLIHNLNGVPKAGENGFDRDNWDDDFITYFSEDISMDECMRRYSERLAKL